MHSFKINKKHTKKSNPKKPIWELSGDGQVYSSLVAVPRNITNRHSAQSITIAQTVVVQGWATTSVTVPVFVASQFQFADIDQYAALASIFDQYKFLSIEARIESRGTNQASLAGTFTSVIDFDDNNILASLGEANDYTNAVTSSTIANHYRRFVPHIAVAVYNGAFSAFKNDPADWIDAASPTVKHYGLKAAFTPTTAVTLFDLILIYHIELRSVR